MERKISFSIAKSGFRVNKRNVTTINSSNKVIESSQESSQESESFQSSEEMESSQEEEEHIDPWSRIQDEGSDCNEAQLKALIKEYSQLSVRRTVGTGPNCPS